MMNDTIIKIQQQLRALTIQSQNRYYNAAHSNTSDKIQDGSCIFYVDTVNNVFVVDSTAGVMDPIHINPFDRSINNVSNINGIDFMHLMKGLEGKNGIKVEPYVNEDGSYKEGWWKVSIEKTLYDFITKIDKVYRKLDDLNYKRLSYEDREHPIGEDVIFSIQRFNGIMEIRLKEDGVVYTLDMTDMVKDDWSFELKPDVKFHWNNLGFIWVHRIETYDSYEVDLLFEIVSLKEAVYINDTIALNSKFENYRTLKDLSYDDDQLALKGYVDSEIAKIDTDIDLSSYRKLDDLLYEKYGDLFVTEITEYRINFFHPNCTARIKGTYGTNNLPFNVKIVLDKYESMMVPIGEDGNHIWAHWNCNPDNYFCVMKENTELPITVSYIRKVMEDRIALHEEIKSLYLKKDEANETYLNKTDAQETYLNKTDAQETYLNKEDAAVTYLNKSDAETIYLNKTDAETIYRSKTDLDFINGAGVKDKLCLKSYADGTYRKMIDRKWNVTDTLALTSEVDSNHQFVIENYRKKNNIAYGIDLDGNHFTFESIGDKTWKIEPQEAAIIYIKVHMHIFIISLSSNDSYTDDGRPCWRTLIPSEGCKVIWYSDDHTVKVKGISTTDIIDFTLTDIYQQDPSVTLDRFVLASEMDILNNEITNLKEALRSAGINI